MPRSVRNAELEQFWRGHLARHAASGDSVRNYCRSHGLREPSFYLWRRTLALRDRQAAAPAFLPVAIVAATTTGAETPIEIALADGRCVRVRAGCDRALLADVLGLLATGGRPC